MAMTGPGIMATDAAAEEARALAAEPLRHLIQLATDYRRKMPETGNHQKQSILDALDTAHQMVTEQLRCANEILAAIKSGDVDLAVGLYTQLVYTPATPSAYQAIIGTLKGAHVADKLKLKLNLVVADLWNFVDRAYLLYARRLLSDEPIDSRELPACESMDGFRNAAETWRQLCRAVPADDRKLSVTREIVAQRFIEFKVRNSSKVPRRLQVEHELETEKTVKIDYSVKNDEGVGSTSEEKRNLRGKLSTPDGVVGLLEDWFSEWVDSLKRASLEVRLFGDIAELKRLIIDIDV